MPGHPESSQGRAMASLLMDCSAHATCYRAACAAFVSLRGSPGFGLAAQQAFAALGSYQRLFSLLPLWLLSFQLVDFFCSAQGGCTKLHSACVCVCVCFPGPSSIFHVCCDVLGGSYQRSP